MGFNLDELRRRLPSARQVASDLFGIKWRGNQARCPRAENHAHGDRNPSFVFLARKNRLHCYAKLCFGDRPVDVFDFVMQMERCDFRAAAERLDELYGLATLRRDSKKGIVAKTLSQLKKEGWEVAAEYSMGDGVRKLRLEHPDRIQPEKGRPEKTFLWQHRDENGSWKPGRAGRSYQAYVNTLFRERDQIEWALGVESERSADAAGALEVPAFSFKEITEENSAVFAGLDLSFLPDKDDAGRKLMWRSIELLRPHARRISVIEPPEKWPEAGDLYDAIVAGSSRDLVEALLALAKPIEPTSAPDGKNVEAPSRIWTLASLRGATFESPATIVEDIIAEGETVGLIGKPKAGKSRLAQQLALSVSRGETFLGRAVPQRRRVLIIDLENRPAGVRSRFQKMSQAAPGDEWLFIYAPQTLADAGLTLSSRDGIERLGRLVAEIKPDLLIIDTWRLLLGGDENKKEVVVNGLRALSALRRKLPRLAIIVVHHTRKTQREVSPLLRIDPSAWVENASGHYSLIGHLEACFGLEREIDKSGDEVIVFGGISRSAASSTLLLREDTDTLKFRTAEDEDVVEKLLTEKERAAWHAVKALPEFTFTTVLEKANTKNRKMVASMLRKLSSMDIIQKLTTGLYSKTTK